MARLEELIGNECLEAMNRFSSRSSRSFKRSPPENQYEILSALPSPGYVLGLLEREITIGMGYIIKDGNVSSKPNPDLRNDPRFDEGYVPDDEQERILFPVSESVENAQLDYQFACKYRDGYSEALNHLQTTYPENISMQRLVKKLTPNLETEVMKGA